MDEEDLAENGLTTLTSGLKWFNTHKNLYSLNRTVTKRIFTKEVWQLCM